MRHNVDHELKSNQYAGQTVPAAEGHSFAMTNNRMKWIVMFVATLAVAGLLSPWASSSPDGLERVAEDHGFLDSATSIYQRAPIPDYVVAGLPGDALQVGAAGVIGAVMLLVLLRLISKRYGKGNDRRFDGHIE